MNSGRKTHPLPIPVARVLRQLGSNISYARRRRRIPVAIMAERASISPTTLNKVEKGEPGVSLGIYARVFFVLGLIDQVGNLADPGMDVLGLELAEEDLPKRIRKMSPSKPSGPDRGDVD